MSQPRPVELGQVAYQAYRDWIGWKDQDWPMAAWEELDQTIQHAWVASAGAVERAILTPPKRAEE